MSTRRKAARESVIDSTPPQTRLSRSPARSRKVSPARRNQPARQSAGKSPARRSPGRPPKYPARKSPARTAKVNTEPEPELQLVPPKTPSKRPSLKIEVQRLEEITQSQFDIYRGTRSKRRESVAKETEYENKENNLSEVRKRISVDRRSSKLRETDVISDLRSLRRSSSKTITHSESVSKSKSKSHATYSDEENSTDEHFGQNQPFRSEVSRKLSTPLRNSYNNITQVAKQWEFGGRCGTAALIIVIPLIVMTILTTCIETCSIKTILNFSPFKSMALWLSMPAIAFIGTQVLIQGTIAVIPYFGRKTDGMDDTGKIHCFNALFSSMFTVPLVYGLHHLKFINNELILKEYLKLATASYIIAVILSIALYLKSRNLDREERNPYGNTGYFLYDFFMGREKHPSVKRLEVKIWVSRICNINTLILCSLILTKQLHWTGSTLQDINLDNIGDTLNNIKISNLTAVVFSLMQMIYILNFIVNEYKVISTFSWQCEGVGYLQTVSSALYPFYFTTLSKYVADTSLALSTNYLVIASLLYSLGFYIMLKSNHIKYQFRRNPLQHSLANLDSMVTFHGKRLITSGFWGTLRHPNYLGDILIHIALALPGLISGHLVAASPALITIMVLLHRAWRDDARCERRYGSAWDRYCKRVPYVLIPKVV